MEAEAETPEAAALVKLENVKERISSQFGAAVDIALSGNLKEVEAGHTVPPEAENAENLIKREEELEVAENLNTERKFGNSESIEFSESPSLAIKASEEILQPSTDNEDKAKTISINTEPMENESQMQKDQTEDFVEETSHTSKNYKIEACGNQTLSQNASEDNVGLLKSSTVTTEQSNDENITQNPPAVPITLVSDDLSLQEEKSDAGGGAFMNNMKQKIGAFFSLDHHLVENSEVVSDDKMTTEICASQIEEAKGVNSSEKDQTAGHKSDDNQNFKSKEEENMISNMELEARNKEEIVAEDLNADNISIKEETIISSFQKEELECKRSSNLEGMANSSETIRQTEYRDGEKMVGDDNPQHMLNDKKELTPKMRHGDLDFKANDLDDKLDETPIEQVHEKPRIVEATEEAEKDIKENNCSVEVLNNISIGELQGNESSKKDNEAKLEEEMQEKLKFSRARDEHSEKQNIEENETTEELSTVSNKDENEVHQRLKEVTGGQSKEKILDDDTVTDISKVPMEEETIEDISQEHEVGKEHAITREGQGEVELILEDVSVTEPSTTLHREEFIKEIPGEDKTEAEEHETKAKEFNFPVESTSEVVVSTEKEVILNTRDEEEQQKSHHADPNKETTVEESVQKKSSEDLHNTSSGLNFEAIELTDNIEIKNIKDVEDLDKIQDADCTDENTEEEITRKEKPGEEKMEAEEHKAEAKESNFPMESTSEVPNSTEKKEPLNSKDEDEQHKEHHPDSVIKTTGKESVQEKSGEDLNHSYIGLNFEATELAENIEIKNIKDVEDLNKIQDADCTDEITEEEITQKEIPEDNKMEAEEHGAKAKESNFPMESTSEEPDSTEMKEPLNSKDEQKQHKNHHPNSIIETTGEESVHERSGEDMNNTSIGFNFEATELTENKEIISITEVDDLNKIQDADCTNEIAEEEVTQKEIPGEDKMELVEQEAEAKESIFPMESNSEVPDSTETEGTLNTQDGKEQQKNHHIEELVQKNEYLNNNSTGLNFEATELTKNTEIKNIKDVEDLNKIQDADCTDEIAESEIIQKEGTEKLHTDPSLVLQVTEEQRNEEVLKGEDGTNYNLNNTSLEKETEKASLPETEQEGNKMIDLPKELEMAERSFTEETIKTESTDHFEDDETQKEEVITSSDLASLEENLSPGALNEETECLGVESQKKNVDDSTTSHADPRKGVKEITVVISDEEVHEANTDVPKEEHNIEIIPMIEEPEITISQSHQEKFQDRETTVEVIQKGETDSIKNEKSGESHSTQVVDHSDAKESSSCTKTEKDQHSSTIFGTEGEVNHERNIAEDDAVNDQSTIPLKDETIIQSCTEEEANEQNEIKLEPKLKDEKQIQSSVKHSTTAIIQNEQACDEQRIADVVKDTEIPTEEDNILKDITSVHIEEEAIDVSTREDKNESWKADGEVSQDLEYTEKELMQDTIVKENSINTVEDETVAENSHKDEKVSASLDVARPSIEIDEHVINGNDSVTNHSTMYDEAAAAKQSFQEDEIEKPEKEVSGDIEPAVTSNDSREKIMEDDIFTEPFAASTDDVDISSHEEEVHVRLEPNIQDEAVEEHTLQELSTEEPHTVSVEKSTSKESSQEVEAQEELKTDAAEEELKTDAAEEDFGKQTTEDGTGTDIPMLSDKDKTPEVSSQEDEKVANVPRAEVVESDLEPTEGGNPYVKETEIVSLEEGEDQKKSLINHVTTESPLDELKTSYAGGDAANQTIEGAPVVSEETTKRSSQEDSVKPPGDEAKEYDSLFIEGGSDFAKGTGGVSLEEEEDQRKSLVNFGAMVAPSEEITKMESNDNPFYTTIHSSTSDEQVIDESQEKTEHTSNTHESNSVTLLQEKLSLHEAGPGETIVANSNLPSEKIFSTPIEENRGISQDAVVEDVKQIESSNLAENATRDTFPREYSDADGAKQEKSEIVEASAVETQLKDQDIETTLASDKISTKPSSDDIAEEMLHESFMLDTDKQTLATYRMKEDISNESQVEDEMMDKKAEAPLLAQTKGEVGIEKEDHIKLEQDSGMGTENFDPKSSIPEVEQENLISKTKDVDVILKREKVMELNELRESSGSESSDPVLKQNVLEDEEKFTAPCANMERDVQEEDHINKPDQTLGESKNEFMKVEEMLVEVQAADPSHQISDSYNTAENVSLLQNLEEVDACEEVTKAAEAVDHDLSHEPTSELEIVNDIENIKDQDAIPVEDHKVGQNIQEENNDNKNLEEAWPKLDVEDQNDVNQPMIETNTSREMPRGVETVDESKNIKEQSIEEEVACVEVSVDDTLVKEDLKEIDPCGEITKDTELVGHDLSHEPTSEIEIVNGKENIKDHDAILVEDHKVGQNIQEGENDNKNLEEASPKLDVEDRDDVNQPMTETNVNMEMPRGVETVDKRENIEKQSIEEEVACVEVSTDDTLVKENLEEVDQFGEVTKATEAVEHDLQHEPPSEIEIVNDRGKIKNHDAIFVEDHKVGKNNQEEGNGNRNLEEARPKLEVEDRNDVNQPMLETNVNREIPRGVETVDESENIEKQSIEEEVASVEVSADDILVKKNLEEVDPCGTVTKATEAIDHDLRHEPPSEIEIVNDGENITDQDAIPVEDHKVCQNIQEGDNDSRNLEKVRPKLDVEDQTDVNQPMTETNANKEMPRGVETVDESENIEKQSIEEEVACVEASADETLVKEVKDSDSIFTERTTKTTDSNEVTKTRTLTHMEDQNNANADTEASKEEILEQEDSEKFEEVSEAVSKVSEDSKEVTEIGTLAHMEKQNNANADTKTSKEEILEQEDSEKLEEDSEAVSKVSEDSNEVTETGILAHMEDQNNANADTKASKEEILEQDDSEKPEEVSKAVPEDNMKKETKEKGDDTNNVLQTSPNIMVTEETSITKAEDEAENIVDMFHTSTDVESFKMDETVGTCIKGDDNDKTSLEKTPDMVSQLHTNENENRDQKSVIVEKNINDILQSGIPVKNTEESSEEDKQSADSVIPDENIKTAKVENLDETVDNINITHSSAENISMGEADEKHKEKSEFESDIDKEGFQSVSEDQIPDRLVTINKVVYKDDEDTDTTIIGVGSVKEAFQEGKQGEYIKEANCESEAEDDKGKRTIEASETTENETITEELPKHPENACATENDERQALEKEQSANYSGQLTYDEKSIKGSHEEDEREKDDVKEKATELVAEEQIPESNAEKDQREDAYEAKEAPNTEILNDEMMKGGHLQDQISVSKISVQENSHGEETKETEVEEQLPTLVSEKQHNELKDVRHEEGKSNATTEEEVNQMIKSSDLMLVAQDISQTDESTKTVDVEYKEGESWKLEDVPVKTAPPQEAPNELICETITRHLEKRGSEARVATDSEDFIDLKKTSSSNFGTMSTTEKLQIREDLPTDVLDASSVVKVSQKEIQEKEGMSTDGEEKQEVALVEKVWMEPNIPTEENEKNIEHQTPVPQISNEGVEKINDLNIQEKLGANEEGVLTLLKQDEIPQEVKILDKTSDVIDDKKISEGDNNIAGKKENVSSIKSIEVPSVPVSLNGSSLQTAEDEEGTLAKTQSPEVIEAECETGQKLQNLDEEATLYSKSSATKGAQSFDLLIISRKDIEQAEEEEQKKEDSGSDAPVMVETSRDIDVKPTPTKKSHNILSGVGSKVKHSISKVKKAITGKSSHSKQLSPD